MLKFIAVKPVVTLVGGQQVQSSKKVKTFTGTVMSTLYKSYNDYCKSKGYTTQVITLDTQSFGGLAWSNGHEVITFHRVE
jgi:hypothetical protein